MQEKTGGATRKKTGFAAGILLWRSLQTDGISAILARRYVIAINAEQSYRLLRDAKRSADVYSWQARYRAETLQQ